MNKGFFRLQIALSTMWVLGLFIFKVHQNADDAWLDGFEWFMDWSKESPVDASILFFGPPIALHLLLWVVGWIWRGFKEA